MQNFACIEIYIEKCQVKTKQKNCKKKIIKNPPPDLKLRQDMKIILFYNLLFVYF